MNKVLKSATLLIYLAIIIALTNNVYSQQPKLQYIKYDTVKGNPVMDKNFNVYQAGIYVNPVNGIRSWQITKFDKNLNFLWTKNYQRYSNQNGSVQSSVVDDSCNIYVTGYYVKSSITEEAITMKLDSNGNIKWITVEGNSGLDQDEAKKIILAKDGYLYVGGSTMRTGEDMNIFLIKFNTSGEKIWKRIFNTPGAFSNADDTFTNLEVDDFGNSYIAYEMQDSPNPNKASLLKYDTDGKIKFTYNDFSYYSSYTDNLTIFRNNSIYVTGGFINSDTNKSKVILYKFDSTGNLNWSKTFAKSEEFRNKSYDVICDTIGSVYIGGMCYAQRVNNPSLYDSYLMLLKYSSEGNLDWSRFKTGGNNLNVGYYFGLKIDKFGLLYLQGSLFYPVSSLDGITQKYDNSGNELWNIRYAYQDSSFDFLQFQFFYPNNDFLLIGGYTTNSTSAISKIAYMRYSQPLKITNTGNTIPEKFELSQNYPNPFNPQTKIKFSIVQKDVYTLKLYDITGRELMRMSYDNLSPGSYEYTFNMNNFASGNYFYELSSSKERIVKQMLLIK